MTLCIVLDRPNRVGEAHTRRKCEPLAVLASHDDPRLAILPDANSECRCRFVEVRARRFERDTTISVRCVVGILGSDLALKVRA
jgi:hypothetical protein